MVQAVKASDLQQHGPSPRDPEAVQHLADLGPGQVPVLFSQRIDRGIDQELGDGQPLGKPRQREDRRIVFQDMPAEHRPDRTMRLAGIEMAAPHPLPPLAMIDQRRRLRIMDEHEIRIEIQCLGVSGRDVQVGAVHLVGNGDRASLESIGNPPRDIGKLLCARDDFPPRLDPHGLHDGHQPPEDFRHAASVAHGADVQKPLAPDQIAQSMQEVDRALRSHFTILFQLPDHRMILNARRPGSRQAVPLQQALFDAIGFGLAGFRHEIEPVITVGPQGEGIRTVRHRRELRLAQQFHRHRSGKFL
jgi:hypothetical protein